MSRRRAPMAPPSIEGFRFIELLGSGGHADVFLYRQDRPSRSVAIKVLTPEAAARRGASLDAEADAMAALSAHPHIVTIFGATATADGLPCLVMEYYPGDNYGVRCRRELFSVPDVLRVGIQVASAVEAAHQAGILHRDIKPSNILESSYGQPSLADFGIATTGIDQEAQGMSVPWAPPELLDGSGIGDARSDVYSLAATLYTLLEGRSPFEVVDGENKPLDLIDRIAHTPVPPLTIEGVPESLERLLTVAMAKAPSDRPGNVAAFARSLQEIELELRLAQTPFEVRGERAASARIRERGGDEDPDGTRLKSPKVIRSQGALALPSRSGTAAAANDATVSRRGAVPQGHRPPASSPPSLGRSGEPIASEPLVGDRRNLARHSGFETDQRPTADPLRLAAHGSAFGLGAIVLAALLWWIISSNPVQTDDDADTDPVQPTTTSRPIVSSVVVAPPQPTEARLSDTGELSWRLPDEVGDDLVLQVRVAGGAVATSLPVAGGESSVQLDEDPDACFEVSTVRSPHVSESVSVGSCDDGA